MKIKKYSFGATFTPIVSKLLSEPGQENQAQSNSQPEATKEGFEFTKEVYNAIKAADGLFSDESVFSAEAGKVIDIINSELTSSNEKAKAVMNLQLMANQLTHNKALYNSVVEKVAEEDLSNDLAMDSRGNFYVVKDGKVTTASLPQIKDNSDQYYMMTINDVLQYRQKDPVSFLDQKILTDINGATGMKEVMSQITDIIHKIGKSDSSGYTAKIGNTVQKGLEYLFAPMTNGNSTSLMSYDGLYELKRSDSNAAQSINAAVNYIFTHLNDNAKNVLRANAFKMGFDSPNQLIELAIRENINSSLELNYIKPEDITGKKKSGSGSGSGSESLTQDSWAHSVFKGQGLPIVENITLGNNLRMTMPAKMVNNVLTKDGNQLGVSRLSQSYRNLQEQGLVDTNGSVYFGDIPLKSPALEGFDIVVDNLDGMHIVNMPVMDNGEINWDIYNVMDDIQNEIVKNNIQNPSDQARIWAENGFDYDPELKTGIPKGGLKTKRFMVQAGYTSTASDNIDSKLLKESRAIEEAEDGYVEHLGMRYNMNPIENKDKIDLEHGAFGKNYQGMIYIPMSSNENDVLVSNNLAYTPKVNTNEIKAMQDAAIYSGGYDAGTREFKTIENSTVDDL